MSVLAPPALFTSDTKSITPPLDDTWAYLEDPHCRPWMAMVLNLNLGDFAGAPGSLADLAYADASGEPRRLPRWSLRNGAPSLLARNVLEVVVGVTGRACSAHCVAPELEVYSTCVLLGQRAQL